MKKENIDSNEVATEKECKDSDTNVVLFQLSVKFHEESTLCPECGGVGWFDIQIDVHSEPNPVATLYQCEDCENPFYVGEIWKNMGAPSSYLNASNWQNILVQIFPSEAFKISRCV